MDYLSRIFYFFKADASNDVIVGTFVMIYVIKRGEISFKKFW